jgi:hypothetical protein
MWRKPSGSAEILYELGTFRSSVILMAKLPRPSSTVVGISLTVGFFAILFGGLYSLRGYTVLGIPSEEARDKYGIKVDSLAPRGTRVLDVKKNRWDFVLRGKCSPEVAEEWMKEQIKGEQMDSVNPKSTLMLKFALDEPWMEFTKLYRTDIRLYTQKGIRQYKYVGYHEPSQTWLRFQSSF